MCGSIRNPFRLVYYILFNSLFDHQINDLGELAKNRKELLATDVLGHASGGLSLRGVLLTQNIADAAELRKTVLAVPKEACLMAPVLQQIDEIVELTSKEQSDLFQHSLDNIGYSVTSSIKGNFYTSSGEASGNLKQEKEISAETESHHKKMFQSRVLLSIVPTACCEMQVHNMRLSEDALQDLMKIEGLVKNGANEDIVKTQIKEFFDHFGSHVNAGTVHFGGIYKWVATFFEESNSNTNTIKSMIQDVHSAFISLSHSGFAFGIGGMVNGEHIKGQASLSGRYNSSELSKTQLTMTKKGGPQEVSTLPLWKMGLVTHNDTWAIVDRGKMSNFKGIWELLINHKQDFSDATQLSALMQKTWQAIDVDSANNQLKANQFSNAFEGMHKMTENMKVWITDPTFISRTSEYLETVLNEIEQVYNDTGNKEIWTNMVNQKKEVQQFFGQIAQNVHDNVHSESQVSHLKYLFKKIFPDNLSNLNEFPEKELIQEWLYDTSKGESFLLPSIFADAEVETIDDFHAIMNDKYIPSIQIAIAQNSDQTMAVRDALNKDITVDFASGVLQLLCALERKQDIYQHFFLLTLLTKLSYNSKSHSFPLLLDLDSLESFAKRLDEEKTKYMKFVPYTSADEIRLQAYLLNLTVNVRSSTSHMEEWFTNHIKLLYNVLKPEISQARNLYASESPFQWDKFNSVTKSMMTGQSTPLQGEVLQLDGLEIINVQTDRELIKTSKDESRTLEDTNQSFLELFDTLGLREYYPCRLTSQQVMAIQNDIKEVKVTDVAFRILKRIIMIDFRGREDEITKHVNSESVSNEGVDIGVDEFFSEFDEGIQSTISLNPMDVFLATFSCCDLILRQIIVQKLFLCRLAVPFLLPGFSTKSLLLNQWALRTIVVEWRDKNQAALETSIVAHPSDIVSFIRLGRPTLSKSKSINDILSDNGHNTFFNKDCPGSMVPRIYCDGLVEGSWYLPSGKAEDYLKSITMFLNLRGDAVESKRQVSLLSEISSVLVLLVDIDEIVNPAIGSAIQEIYNMKSVEHEICGITMPLCKRCAQSAIIKEIQAIPDKPCWQRENGRKEQDDHYIQRREGEKYK